MGGEDYSCLCTFYASAIPKHNNYYKFVDWLQLVITSSVQATYKLFAATIVVAMVELLNFI